MKKIAVIFITLIIVALIVFLFIPWWVQRHERNIVTAYVVTENISKGTLITKNMVKPQRISTLGLNEDVVVMREKGDALSNKDVIDKYAKYDMLKGELIMKSKLQDIKQVDAGYMYSIEKGYYAYPIRTDLETTAAGVLMPGDYIDLYVFAKDRSLGAAGTVIADEKLRDIHILDIRGQAGTISTQSSTTSGTSAARTEQRTPRVIVLKLNDEQLRELIRYEGLGELKIAFRRRGDSAKKQVNNIDYIPSAYEKAVVPPPTNIQQLADGQTTEAGAQTGSGTTSAVQQ